MGRAHEETCTCTFCQNPIYLEKESYIKDIGETIFHVDCYGKYIAFVYDRYQEVV